MCIPKCICFFLMRGKISVEYGVLQDNRLEKVQGIFKLQNECFAIKDLQMDLLRLYFEFFGFFLFFNPYHS